MGVCQTRTKRADRPRKQGGSLLKIKKGHVPPGVLQIVRILQRHSYEAYPVGGAVRDLLLRQSPEDWDIATNAAPKAIEKLFKKTLPTGKAFGTITVIIRSKLFQVTTYRMEGKYRDRRRPDQISFVGELESDLSRRDFTINAMALDLSDYNVIDPFDGITDLRKRILRTVGNADARFREDTLRAVRAGRFIAQHKLKPKPEVTRAARRVVKHISSLSAERIRDELTKLLLAPKPSPGLRWLDKVGILSRIFPELMKGKACMQGGWHQYDVFRHTLETIDAAPPDLQIRLAALFHDIAKPATRTREGRRYHFYRHERLGADRTARILKRLRFPNRTVSNVTHLVRHHLFDADPIYKSDRAVRRLIQRVGNDLIDDLIELRKADIRGCGPKRRIGPELKKLSKKIAKIREAEEAITLEDLVIDGTDVMRWLKIPPGPRVGKVLQSLLDRVLEDPEKNTRSHLRREIQDLDAAR